MSTKTTCPTWCDNHLTETVDAPFAPKTREVHRTTVTVGEITVPIETSPDWTGPLDLPILTDEVRSVDASAARDYANALLRAAELIEQD
ncbi:hypothetical protein M3697_02625 [Janibacter melonis]|uniref:hypothetical protein n=1 Tax=Janibacter melonis TaxID=262209 RepID=UPI002042DA52|nr:hypothetical protein [Janibacter melonis]MCM3554010.1 hypothetical protein [Janibacter melonis]